MNNANVVIEFVHGDLLENRFNQLLDLNRNNVTIRMVSQHIFAFNIKQISFRRKVELLIRKGARIVLIIDVEHYNTNEIIRTAADDLENLGVVVKKFRNIHAKIVLLETRKDKGFLVSSANLSNNALHNNKEAGIFVMNESSSIFDSANEFIKSLLQKTYTR